ncbi:MAG: cytochrome c oxidase subunit II [Planctomycetota bacterium]
MRKLWSLLFLLVPVGAVYLFWIAPDYQWSLPTNKSSFGEGIDKLYNLILWITGVTFVLVNAFLVYFMFRYSAKRENKAAAHVHGNHALEVIWTIVPSLILIFIAFVQMKEWQEVKFQSKFPDALQEKAETEAGEKPSLVQAMARVTARQFEWRITYPGPDGQYDTVDDIQTVNELHMPGYKGDEGQEPIPFLIDLESADVLHSFFVPQFRIKQDAVPGMTIKVWFDAKLDGGPEDDLEFERLPKNQYDLVCAELCGWGHYKMKGRVYVHTPEEYQAWLESQGPE